MGQARKSLWIETFRWTYTTPDTGNGQARKSLWIETYNSLRVGNISMGQARKSLWIETELPFGIYCKHDGQARKSLWIETSGIYIGSYNTPVRLVRACGSKQERCGGTD